MGRGALSLQNEDPTPQDGLGKITTSKVWARGRDGSGNGRLSEVRFSFPPSLLLEQEEEREG